MKGTLVHFKQILKGKIFMKSKLNEITKASHKYKIHIWKKRLKKILSFKTEWIIGLKNPSFGLNSENLQRFTFVLIEENGFFKRWKPVFVVPFYLSLKRKKKKEISETSNRVFQNKNHDRSFLSKIIMKIIICRPITSD